MKDSNIWMDPDYQIFMLAMELGSLSAVARKTGKDLGNLSRTLGRLEKIHGPLFVRHQTGLKATTAGNDLSRALVSATSAFSRSLKSLEASEIRIGFSPPLGFGFFGKHFFPLLDELELTPQFQLASSIELFELLKKRELDFILAPRSPQFPGIISSPLFSTKLALCSKNGKTSSKLIRSEQLFDLEKRLLGLNIDQTVIMNDYFVAASLLSSSDDHMGILPECILSHFPELKVHNHSFLDEKVYAITWKGSPGVKLLKRVKQELDKSLGGKKN